MPDFGQRVNGVMVLLLKGPDGWEILYTKRASSLSRQPGDICFPGGGGIGGESPLETALRETEEELHIPQKDIQLIGQPDYIIAPFRGLIFPFVGVVPGLAVSEIFFQKEEVDKVFTVPVTYFLNTEPFIGKIYYQRKFSENFPFHWIQNGENYPFANMEQQEIFYPHENGTIWGITARITQNICTLLKRCVD